MHNIIRKIIVGDNPLKAMAYYVGQKAGESKVEAIVFDDKYMHAYGREKYIIYIKHPSDGVMLWKSISNMPVLIEYDCDFSK